jgi:hypothetical protein
MLRCRPVASWGLVIASLALTGRGVSAHPASGIVVDERGQVFFCQHGHAVWRIDTQGQLTRFHPSSSFHWLALDPNGDFARSDFGEFFERLTPPGAKPALLMCSDFPFVVSRDGHLYYSNARDGRVRIIKRAPDGRESVLVGGGPGRGDAALHAGINDMAVGPDGSLYVSQRDAVRKVTRDGAVSTIASGIVDEGCATDLPPGLPRPPFLRGLAVDSRGTVYAAATSCRSVLKITADGRVTVLLRAQAPWSPTGVAVADGTVYILEHSNPLAEGGPGVPRVRKVASDGVTTTLATVEEKR